MGQQHFEFEYEIKASPKVLYPYISTASGLEQWFAEKVIVKNTDLFQFHWDDEIHIGHLVQNKANKLVKFDFTNEALPPVSAIIEIKLEVSELTNATYLKIYDSASTFKNPNDAKELWDYLTDKLKEIVGS
jgi:hypothetical protein